VVISTGGIGPTVDDLTTETVARIAGVGLRRDPGTVEHMTRLFASINRTMPPNNLKQADFPEGAEIIPNPLGTAPGFRLAIPRDGRLTQLIVLPGVPREMKPMMENWVVPWIRANRGTDRVIAMRIFQTFGMSESALDEAVKGVIGPEEAKIGLRASFPQISLRLTVEGEPGRAQRTLDELAARVRAKLSDFVFAEGDVSMEEVMGRLFAEKHLTLAVAESCTGGLIGHRITNVPGSSRYLVGDLVTYSNEMKQAMLGVSAATLEKFGAVSEECVREMAAGVRTRTGANVGIATSGIAGPDGGTPDKPVGTVCIAIDSDDVKYARRFQMRGTRDWVKLLSSQVALDWLRRYALGVPVADSMLFRR
jgi:nicotinamide-nucleotide amidase